MGARVLVKKNQFWRYVFNFQDQVPEGLKGNKKEREPNKVNTYLKILPVQIDTPVISSHSN